MKSIILMIASVLLLFSTEAALAQSAASKISIQGVLRDGQGAIVANGPQSMKFKLFSQESGGTVLWEEEATVNVAGGLYSHLMGSVNALNPAIFGQTVYVGVFVDDSELLPRTELAYAPQTVAAQFAANGVVPGSVTSFAGATIPVGWLLCNGQALSADDYPNLFAVLGTNFGNGSSGINGGASMDFNLPDLRAEFIRGLDNGRGVDANRVLGSAQGSATAKPNNPFTGTTSPGGSHQHNFTVQSTSNVFEKHASQSNVSAGSQGGETGSNHTSNAGSHGHTIILNGGGDPETRPRNFSLRYIIKY
jgi:microcystin-dependent protein